MLGCLSPDEGVHEGFEYCARMRDATLCASQSQGPFIRLTLAMHFLPEMDGL